MLQLLQLELAGSRSNGEGTTSILDMVLSDSDNILAQIVSWSKAVPYTQADPLILLQLQFFETLLTCSVGGQSVLSHVKVLHPLVSLLELVNSLPSSHTPSNRLQSTLLELVQAQIPRPDRQRSCLHHRAIAQARSTHSSFSGFIREIRIRVR